MAQQMHSSPASAIAFYDPTLGVVVVASRSPDFSVGHVIDIALLYQG
jgi:CRISPR-associated Csx3 family protein